MFKKASRKAVRLRLGLIGPAGSGKTYSALKVAHHLGGRIALIDTEHGSASKRVARRRHTGARWVYLRRARARDLAADLYRGDPLRRHGWIRHPHHRLAVPRMDRQGGALELVDRAAAKAKGPFALAPRHAPYNELVDTMLASPVT